MRKLLIMILLICMYVSISGVMADDQGDDIDSKLLAGEWVVLEGTSEMDDYGYIGIGKASKNIISSDKPALLALRCQDKKLVVFIDLMTSPTTERSNIDLTTVRIRFDDEKPKKRKWANNTNPHIIASRKSKKLIKEMNEAQIMKLEFTEVAKGQTVVIFDLSGGKPYLKQVADACNINL